MKAHSFGYVVTTAETQRWFGTRRGAEKFARANGGSVAPSKENRPFAEIERPVEIGPNPRNYPKGSMFNP